MANINTQPAGALELLRLNLEGEFPRDLDNSVKPFVEMSKFYFDGLGIKSSRMSQAGFNGSFSGMNMVIPAGEIWALRGTSLTVTNNDAAGIAYNVSILLQEAVGRLAVLATTPSNISMSSGHAFIIGNTWTDPILVDGGNNVIRAQLNSISGIPAAGCSFQLDVLYHLLTLR